MIPPLLAAGRKPRRVFHLPLRGRENFAFQRENFCFAERISHFVGENFFLLRKNREAPKPFRIAGFVYPLSRRSSEDGTREILVSQ